MIRPVERDLHVLKYFSSVITVSEGQVINVTDPSLRSCPLARHFYPELKDADPENMESLKDAIRGIIESKIMNYGFFTNDRSFHFPKCVVPYGASEMLAASLKNRFIEAAVVVCDGAGTVITQFPETVQGIGARMNTLIFTSPVKGILGKLDDAGCHVVFRDNAWIDQVKGVEKAISLGYEKIGVTIAGSVAEQLERIRDLEKKAEVAVTLLAVCTTGISSEKIEMIRQNADLVWSCASGEVRGKIGSVAKLQLSKQIPVFALTERGVAFAASYLNDPSLARNLDATKQYLLSSEMEGWPVCSGFSQKYVRETVLPAEAGKSPRCDSNNKERILV
jgi:putative methanogenesis marker protein 8